MSIDLLQEKVKLEEEVETLRKNILRLWGVDKWGLPQPGHVGPLWMMLNMSYEDYKKWISGVEDGQRSI